MNPRLRRLKNDYERVVAELSGSEYVSVKAVSGDPPTHYQVTYLLTGLMWDASAGAAKQIGEHVVDISLPAGYPKQAPRCTIRTAMWHPNIGDYVCIGDYWSAGVTLADIIVHIGDMIQYRSYNLGSPVNNAAAAWAQRNTRSFPVGVRSVRPRESEQDAPAPVVDVALPPHDIDISLGPIRERQL